MNTYLLKYSFVILYFIKDLKIINGKHKLIKSSKRIQIDINKCKIINK